LLRLRRRTGTAAGRMLVASHAATAELIAHADPLASMACRLGARCVSRHGPNVGARPAHRPVHQTVARPWRPQDRGGCLAHATCGQVIHSADQTDRSAPIALVALMHAGCAALVLAGGRQADPVQGVRATGFSHCAMHPCFGLPQAAFVANPSGLNRSR
jgi:hypothetical protein